MEMHQALGDNTQQALVYIPVRGCWEIFTRKVGNGIIRDIGLVRGDRFNTNSSPLGARACPDTHLDEFDVQWGPRW
ncbi:hypothetical protein FA13DRAFT_1117058 [Coprinellus micaceus]|uniref:Uncharacterized protein n=1 Tax=Coprinellus micaceus TaxID=71717 RepID=A0A4Y7RK32_COPMI|nr:hypothetical protein FA13DRAFT_1117058 [Coprinellus micaceus]